MIRGSTCFIDLNSLSNFNFIRWFWVFGSSIICILIGLVHSTNNFVCAGDNLKLNSYYARLRLLRVDLFSRIPKFTDVIMFEWYLNKWQRLESVAGCCRPLFLGRNGLLLVGLFLSNRLRCARWTTAVSAGIFCVLYRLIAHPIAPRYLQYLLNASRWRNRYMQSLILNS